MVRPMAKRITRWSLPIAVAVLAVVPALLALQSTRAADEEYPSYAEPPLPHGRDIWLATCKPCHTTDIAGAPQVTDKSAWAPRLAQGKDVLYAHALQGLFGPKGTEMPARGGNADLSDSDVRAAVDYMVALVTR